MKLRCYDPRDKAQSLEAPNTWAMTDNPALIMAGMMLAAGGDINWDEVSVLADAADEPVAFRIQVSA